MITRATIALLLGLAVAACNQSTTSQMPPAAAPTASEAPPDPAFVGKVWVSVTPGDPRGSIIVFLPDRSLLMTSCQETYRLSRWDITGDTIRWIENTVPIQADVSMPRPNELNLEIAGRDRVQAYMAAPIPHVCGG